MYAVASGLIEAMKAIMPNSGAGSEWYKIPAQIFSFGAGGIQMWGTLCGTLTGCLSVLNMMKLHGKLGNEIMGWYSTTEFPTGNVWDIYKEGGWKPHYTPVPDNKVLAHTTSDSPLCHVSISKWLSEAGISYNDKGEPPHSAPLKKDRCAKVASDTARKCAELVNDFVQGKFKATDWFAGTESKGCIDCHSYRGKKTAEESQENTLSLMDCRGCHTEDAKIVSKDHPE
ncbi:MAG: C_GCAxxG_C_C family protein [Desulfobacterales bacterium]|uniref:C_GCAxxG_C_C family protein n=1 Tax=Candidatus Desulfaltia bathyphila TaxID=2841697 RepID=A0A8J6T6L7_9BACT|nr:C_GCAxxG_C_C family protein [Candidatus Desulfaltia bathyphila]MBL7195574.1 C_GCAxxG_C_C family protein [Desulfobacterales bacterium]MBL7207059.1 C_GCAxxG_C_C family protein [Desulfobacterales bacterium]